MIRSSARGRTAVAMFVLMGMGLGFVAIPELAATTDPDRNRYAILAADASSPAALLVECILPVCALLAPGGTGASTPRRWHTYFGQGSKQEQGEAVTTIALRVEGMT